MVFSIESLGIESLQLSNGSVLNYKRLLGAPRAGIHLVIHGGNRIESIPGVSDIVSALLTQGTSKKSAESIANAIDDVPMELDFSAHKDFIAVNATFLNEDLNKAVNLLAELLQESTLNDWEKEKIKLNGELLMSLDSPSALAKDNLYQEIFKDSRYQANSQHILAHLLEMKEKTLFLDYYQQAFQASNYAFTVVGDFEKSEIQNCLENAFLKSNKESKSLETFLPTKVLPIANNRYITASRDDSQQLHLYQAWHGPQLSNLEDYYAMTVLNNVLGGAGLSSRLFTEIRDKQGLAYNVRSMLEPSRHATSFILYIGTEPKNRQKVIDGFQIESEKLMTIPLSEDELESAKRNILGRHVILLERASQQAAYYGSKLALGVTQRDLINHVKHVESVTSEMIQRVANVYLSENSIISAVGPTEFL